MSPWIAIHSFIHTSKHVGRQQNVGATYNYVYFVGWSTHAFRLHTYPGEGILSIYTI